MDVAVYAGLSAPIDAILEFFDDLEYVPAQHDPRWAYAFARLKGEDFYVAVASENGRILGTANYTVFQGRLAAIAHANPFMGYGGCSYVPGCEGDVIPTLMRLIGEHARAMGCVTLSSREASPRRHRSRRAGKGNTEDRRHPIGEHAGSGRKRPTAWRR